MRELGGAPVYAKERRVQGKELAKQRVCTLSGQKLLNTDSNTHSLFYKGHREILTMLVP